MKKILMHIENNDPMEGENKVRQYLTKFALSSIRQKKKISFLLVGKILNDSSQWRAI